MELSLSHTLHLFNIFREYDGKENCAIVLEKECIKMFGTKSLNDEHDCNVVSMNSLNIHSTNDDCTSHDENVSYKHVNFCGVHRVCKYTPNREDRFCKRHKYLETKWLQERLEVCAENLKFLMYPILPLFTLLFLYFHITKPLSTIHIALVSPSLRRTSAPIQFTIVFGVLGTQETLFYLVAGLFERDHLNPMISAIFGMILIAC